MSIIRTYSGRMVDLLSPETADIDIEDIAHALSQINRFTGHTCSPWTVADHCIAGSSEVERSLQMEWMLHDAAEAYLGDVSKPLKAIIGPQYLALEARWNAEIVKRWGLRTDSEAHAEIKRVDELMLSAEYVAFMCDRAGSPKDLWPGWDTPEVGWVAERLPNILRGDVKHEYLQRFNHVMWLRGKRQEEAKRGR